MEMKRKYVQAFGNTHTHKASPPAASLPGVFVNHPFRSASLWVGPLPFNAGTFGCPRQCRHSDPLQTPHP